jgi:hypothetical protein
MSKYLEIRVNDIILEIYDIDNGYIGVCIRTIYDNTYRHAFETSCKTWNEVEKTLADLEELIGQARVMTTYGCGKGKMHARTGAME